VREPGSHLDLAKKPVRPDLGGNLGPKDFHCDGTLVSVVAREIHDCHSAFAELALDGVSSSEAGFEARP
jgi:hypothetical protein